MKKILPFFLISLLIVYTSNACTTFFINKNGQLVFGRNYDWITGAGIVCTNLKGLEKTSMKIQDGKTITWVSLFGSVTFNQYGKEFPTGGMNEKGLVVELMWLDGTTYPDADDRPSVGVLQWIQYQLDCYENIDQVIASDKVLRIGKGNAPLHYLVADAKGNAATIEFLQGKMVVHRGKELPFPVLTNDTYDASIRETKNAGSSLSFSNNSIDRFAKACSMVQQYQANDIRMPVTDYAFDILNKVAQGDWTKWSIVYDLSNKKIYFKSNGYATVKTVSFDAFDLSCTAGSRMYNINQPAQGDISGQFTSFSIEAATPILETAVKESSDRVNITDKEKAELVNFTKNIRCKQ